MKALSFLNMVTILSATAKTDKEFDIRLSKLIHLYNQPPKNLQNIFKNISRLDDCLDDYCDNNNNTIHFDDGIFKLICNAQQFIWKIPENINELIININSSFTTFILEFKDDIIKNLGFNQLFSSLIRYYEI